MFFIGKRKYKYNETVFEKIDSKEKAYFHGFLCADGYIIKNGLQLQISIKDEQVLHKMKKFFNVQSIDNEEIIKYSVKKRDQYHTKNKEYKYCSIQINSTKIMNDFIAHRNSKIKSELRLPIFKDKDITMAWIKGYYDGDGSENQTRIASPSKELLIDVSNFFKLSYKPDLHHANTYVLFIGQKILYELTQNYPFGLKRKNVNQINEKSCKPRMKLDFLTHDILKYLIKTHSCGEIGKMFNVPRSSIFARCKALKISIPQRKTGKYPQKVKTKCQFYPCHKCDFISCEWCYCPLYNMTCQGNYIILENGVKDCSNCFIPHTNPNYIVDQLIERNNK